jgi:methionyl-tRNA synthetase
MRARLSLYLAIVLITAAGLACSAPPEKERLQAAGAIADARRAGAATYAPAPLAAAEALMQKYETAVAARDYRLALSSALEATDTAVSAIKQTATEKARASAAAQAAVIQVETLIRTATARLAPGATPRLAASQAERLRASIKTATTTLQDSRTAMGVEDYPAVISSLSPVVEWLAREVTPSGSAPAGRKT